MSAWIRSVTGRAYHFWSVVEGVRIDEELARKASVVHPIASANLAPSAIVEEVRHRRGHRLESGCRFDLSWVRFPLLPPFSIQNPFVILPTNLYGRVVRLL